VRVLVTGGTGFIGSAIVTGFIGSAIVHELASRGHDVAYLAREGSRAWRLDEMGTRARRLTGDLSDAGSYSDAIAAFRPETLVHSAWFGVGNHDRNDIRQLDNVPQSAALLRQAVDAGIKLFVGFGSQAEYGPRANKSDEEATLSPTTLYGAAKVASFHASRLQCQLAGVRFAWMRLFSTYGPRDEAYWMLPGLILKLLAGERPPLTEGRQQWDYCHVADTERAVAAVVESPSAAGPFNVGAGRTQSIRQIAEWIRDNAAPGAPLGFGEVPYRPDQVFHLEADISRLTAATGWTPRVSLEEGLRETVDWYRRNKDRYAATR
jgi:UDP-glucose 4-epimerase